MPEPEYDFVHNFVCLTIRFKAPLRPYLSGGPINDPLNGPINDPLNGLINGPLKVIVGRVYEIIVGSPGIKIGEIAKQIDKSPSSVKRYVKVLTDADLVEYRDSKKTGGLYSKKEIEK